MSVRRCVEECEELAGDRWVCEVLCVLVERDEEDEKLV